MTHLYLVKFSFYYSINLLYRETINDGACWTIISTEESRYTWCETIGPPVEPVTPIPFINNIKCVRVKILLIFLLQNKL